MSRLLENILKNRHQQTLKEFDMTKSGSAMMRHLGSEFLYNVDNDVPIDPEPATWCEVNLENKRCLQKVYNLDNAKFLLYELIHMSEESYHHPEILINQNEVTVTLYTHELNDITDRDIEMSKKIDEIIEDINTIKFG